MPVAFAATFAGVFGAMIGSFLNVVAYRLPRNESLVRPGSHCPGCDTADQALRQRARALAGCCCAGAAATAARRSRRAIRSSRRSPRRSRVAVVLTKHSAVDIALGLVLVGCSSRSR